ncbi:hypothetical protein AGMMS49990_04170 [Endomicrobiia bacterium]|nr:hypothetical protein AGMMS49990_04170 [Endomicrobiia bacterium]
MKMSQMGDANLVAGLFGAVEMETINVGTTLLRKRNKKLLGGVNEKSKRTTSTYTHTKRQATKSLTNCYVL